MDDQSQSQDKEQKEPTAPKKKPPQLPVQPPVEPPPPAQRWQAALGVTTAPFADPTRTRTMVRELNRFLATHQASARFSNHTGLVRSLRGKLYPERPATSVTDMTRVAVDFLRRKNPNTEKMLLGATDYTWLEDGPPGGSRVRLRQADRSGIPVYRATMVFGFDDGGQLSIVTNSWYPISPEADYEADFRLDWDAAARIAIEHVQRELVSTARRPSRPGSAGQDLPQSAIPLPRPGPLRDLTAVPGDVLARGKIVMPLAADKYQAAWLVQVIDSARGHSWLVFVDAQTGDVLAAVESTVETPVSGCVHPSNAHALDFQTTYVELCDGDSLANAPHFRMDGLKFDEPKPRPNGCTCADPDPTGTCVGVEDDGFRSANVYCHLRQALTTFKGIARNAWKQDPLTMPGDTGEPKVEVKLLAEEGSSDYSYNQDTKVHTITFCTGQPSFQVPIDDPARDCEVAYHEYTHAVFRVVQPDLEFPDPESPNVVQPDPAPAGGRFARAIDEGLAFYYGCTLSERPLPEQPGALAEDSHKWGEFAYQAWGTRRHLEREAVDKQGAGHDYLSVYGVFPTYGSGPDPVGSDYACGMVWARALWDVRRVLVECATADAIIMRGLGLAGGVQSELETPAEAIIHADQEYMRGLEPQVGDQRRAHENALRLIFCSRGIVADAPVHDLVAVHLDQTYVLAAVENVAGSDPDSGCLISSDQGQSWLPLGTAGPREAVALAAVKVDDTRAIIWAAAEHRRVVDHHATSVTKIYRYLLVVDVVDEEKEIYTINRNGDWEDMGELSQNVLSLAAMRDPNGNDPEACWVFAGTENGLYKYDGEWPSKPDCLDGLTIYDVSVGGHPHLLIGTDKGTRIYDPVAMVEANGYKSGRPTTPTLVLTPAIDHDNAEHLWAGTARNGIYHFDPKVNKWKQVQAIELPVYCLAAKKTAADWDLYAGTNDGVYHYQNSQWQEFNQVSPNAESIKGTSVAALCRALDPAWLLAGTAQRGLWRRDLVSPPLQWTRLTENFPRIGRLVDVRFPNSDGPSHSFTNEHLPTDGGVGTHVLEVLRDDYGSLSLKVDWGSVDLALYYAAPHIDPSPNVQFGAGLQKQNVDNRDMVETVRRGFYLLAVNCHNAAGYQVTVTLE